MAAFPLRQRKLLLRYLSKSPGLFSGLFALGLLTATLETFSVFTVLPLVTALLRPAGSQLFHWSLILAGLVVLRSAALLAHSRLCARASVAAIHEAKEAVLRTYSSAPEATLLEIRAGRLAQILSRGAASSGTIVLRLPQLAAEAARAAGLTLILLWLNFRVAVALILLGAVLWELFSRAYFLHAYAKSQERSAAETEQSILVTEIARGVRHLRLAGGMDHWRERFKEASREGSRHHAEEMALQTLPKVWFDAGAAGVILVWMLVMMRHDGAQSAFSVPLLAAVFVGAGKLLPCLSAIGRSRLEILGALPGAEDMADFLKDCPQMDAGSAGRPCDVLQPSLKLEGVRFAYSGRPEILKELDLEVPAGRFVVLAGPYGSGKTTLLGLLLGIHAPSGGRVLLNGTALHEYDRSSWWALVGAVPQDAFLFHGTVADNILLGRSGFAREAVERASRLVGAHDFISALPLGYETAVGERGLKLSGGQRQMVILARALLTEPRVLLLDEPGTGLDPDAQARLARVLRRVSAGRTVVVATHQLDWLEWADAAFVFQDGRLNPQLKRPRVADPAS